MLGTERHNSRRIDRQLRGRCARQGDPGLSRFYISMEDDADAAVRQRRAAFDACSTSPCRRASRSSTACSTTAFQQAQKKVEAQNYSIRKRLLQYDDVLNRQREVVYGLRNDAIRGEDPRETVFEVVEEELKLRADALAPDGRAPEAEPLAGFLAWVNARFPLSLKAADAKGKNAEQLVAWIMENLRKAYAQRCEFETPEAMLAIERYVVIRAIDRNWQDHLTEIEDLRKSINLRSYGQRDPLNEYKSEAFTYFEQMMGRVRAGRVRRGCSPRRRICSPSKACCN